MVVFFVPFFQFLGFGFRCEFFGFQFSSALLTDLLGTSSFLRFLVRFPIFRDRFRLCFFGLVLWAFSYVFASFLPIGSVQVGGFFSV